MKNALTLAVAVFTTVSAASALAQHREHERFRTDHWVYDDRYHHDRYYPAPGYVLRALPPGHVALNYRGRHLFFQSGVWYEAGPRGYVVVMPPIGAVVPALPPGYTTVWVNGVPYYYANDIYYVAGPGGYAVAAPPALVAAAPTAPPAAPAPPAAAPPAPQPGATAGTWYYCEPSKAYYPYVSQCSEPWRQVPATPPQ